MDRLDALSLRIKTESTLEFKQKSNSRFARIWKHHWHTIFFHIMVLPRLLMVQTSVKTLKSPDSFLSFIFFLFFQPFALDFMHVHYSPLLHLLPLRFYCVGGGCWDWTQDCCYTLALIGIRSTRLGLIQSWLFISYKTIGSGNIRCIFCPPFFRSFPFLVHFALIIWEF